MVTVDGLTLRGLTVTYPGRPRPTTAVDAVDLDVAVGEVVALLGPSGSGKSSLLRAVAGLEPVAGGRVLFGAADVTTAPVHRRGFGMVFQDGQLFAHRDVAGNVAYGLQTAGVPRAAQRDRVDELLELVGLAGYGSRPVTTLSGGQAQRVALARALAPRPRLLLLDEPLSALDRGLREHLAGELARILRRAGTTALYVTHDHDEAFTVADRVAVLVGGRVAQLDTPERLWRHPVDAGVARFLGYGPLLAAEVRDGTARTALGTVPMPGGAAGSDVVVGLAPGALGLADGGTPARVVGSRFRRGRHELEVVLRTGDRAVVTVPALDAVPGEVTVAVDPARVVVVPLEAAPRPDQAAVGGGAGSPGPRRVARRRGRQ